MDYLDSAYFTIVSFSTIGYGDIYPIKPVILFIFIYRKAF